MSKDRNPKALLQHCIWLQLDTLVAGNQAVAVIFGRLYSGEWQMLTNFLSGAANSPQRYLQNDWHAIHATNLTALKQKLQGIAEPSVQKLSEYLLKASWGKPDNDGNITGYFAEKREAVRCAEALKSMQVVFDLGFSSQVSPILPIKKATYGQDLPNLFAIKIPKDKRERWFPNVKWEDGQSKKMLSLKDIQGLFEKTEWTLNSLAEVRQTSKGDSPDSYTTTFSRKSPEEVEKMARTTTLLTGVLVEASGKSITLNEEQREKLVDIIPSKIKARKHITYTQQTFNFENKSPFNRP